MGTYTIGEVADRSGFTASALRYYEGIGLVPASARTRAGYRVYDDDALARLAFIGRAKQLGCSLEEVTDLLAIWDGERCEPVQRRLHELVTGKIADAQCRAAELVAFTSQLQAAAANLGAEPIDGPCDDGCACLAEPRDAAAPVPVLLGRGDPAIACILEAGALAGRLDDWRALLARARSRTATDDEGVRVEFGDDVPVAEVAALMAAEQQCCAFFAFTLTVDERGTGLEVRAPQNAADLVSGLFGAAS
jgi:MerR family copper efflux transcriptional regulator